MTKYINCSWILPQGTLHFKVDGCPPSGCVNLCSQHTGSSHHMQPNYWACILDLLQMAALYAIYHRCFESDECECLSLQKHVELPFSFSFIHDRMWQKVNFQVKWITWPVFKTWMRLFASCIALIPLGKAWINLLPTALGK